MTKKRNPKPLEVVSQPDPFLEGIMNKDKPKPLFGLLEQQILDMPYAEFQKLVTTRHEKERKEAEEKKKAYLSEKEKKWEPLLGILGRSTDCASEAAAKQVIRELLAVLSPEHDRTSCSDEDLSNGYYSNSDSMPRCTRCCLLETLVHSYPIPDFIKFKITFERDPNA